MPGQVWTALMRPAPEPAGKAVGRVVVLAHAGGGPGALRPVVDHLPEDVEVAEVTLPGRERRHAEPVPARPAAPQDLVRDVLAELAARPALPTVYFGHSMGTRLAVALALAAPDSCRGLVLSARPSAAWRARNTANDDEDGDVWDEASLLDLIRQAGVTPGFVLREPTLRARLLSVLRHDLALSRDLAGFTAGRTLAAPATVLRGDRDPLALGASDGFRQPEPSYEPSMTRETTLPGGHFYLLDRANAPTVAAEITALL